MAWGRVAGLRVGMGPDYTCKCQAQGNNGFIESTSAALCLALLVILASGFATRYNGGLAENDLLKCTLTNPYNQYPTWLEQAHLQLNTEYGRSGAYTWPTI